MKVGEKLGLYEIREKIGSGRMGEVYLASDEQRARPAALKVSLPKFCCDQECGQQFKLEVRSATKLPDPLTNRH